MPANVYKTSNGKRVPSVTTILKNIGWGVDGLMWWAWNEGSEGRGFREKAEEAANVGNMAHFGVQADVRGEPFDVDAIADLSERDRRLVKKCLLAYQRWKSMTNFRMEHSELKLVSEMFKFGGQLDIGAVNMSGEKPKRVIVDFKTGKSYYPKMTAQVAAYGMLWNEQHPDDPIQEYHILRVGKQNASFEHRYWEADESWLETPVRTFMCALELHKLAKDYKEF